MTDMHSVRVNTSAEQPSTTRSGWPALTEALKIAGCPLKPFLSERFPRTKEVFTQYKDFVGPIRVSASTTPTGGGSGAIGGTFDYLVRFLVDPQPDVYLPAKGAWRCGGRMLTALAEVTARLGTCVPSWQELRRGEPVADFTGPAEPATLDPERLARGCWALSMLTELARGVPVERSPLAELALAIVSGEDLLNLASPAALDQRAELRDQAETVLLPALATRTGRWAVGPTFEGSALMNADADLIAAGTLVEIRTVLGSKRKDGSRYATLDGQMLFQLLGYVLLDFPDQFGIREVALFDARYGHLAVWNVPSMLNTLASDTVDLSELRAEFEEFLRNGADPTTPKFAAPAR